MQHPSLLGALASGSPNKELRNAAGARASKQRMADSRGPPGRVTRRSNMGKAPVSDGLQGLHKALAGFAVTGAATK